MKRSILLLLMLVSLWACKDKVAPETAPPVPAETPELVELADTVNLKYLSDSHLLSFAKSEKSVLNRAVNNSQLDSFVLNYDCPQMTDQGKISVYEQNGLTRYILHTFRNGKNLLFTHKYYVFEQQLFMAETMDEVWDFEVGNTTSTRRVVTSSRYVYDHTKARNCQQNKYIVGGQEDITTLDQPTELKPVDCETAEVIRKKYIFLQSIINNDRLHQKPCLFM